jgi:hypothetical protein
MSEKKNNIYYYPLLALSLVFFIGGIFIAYNGHYVPAIIIILSSIGLVNTAKEKNKDV